MKKPHVKMGDEVRDRVTGFRGVITGEFRFLNGCTRFCVQPTVRKDGKYPDAQTFDWPQLELIKAGVVVGQDFEEPDESKKTGGPAPYVDRGRQEPGRRR